MTSTPQTAPALRTVIVRRFEEFLAVRPQWDPLIEASENGVVFARWDWIRIWLEVFQSPAVRLAIICVWRGNALIGVAPFWVQAHRKFGLEMHTLRFLGTGEPEQDEVLPEMLDVFCRRSDVGPVASAVAAAMADDLRWDKAVFSHQLRGSLIESEILPRLRGLARSTQRTSATRYSIQWHAGEVPVLPAPVEYKRRKLNRMGIIDYQCVSSAMGWNNAFEALTQLHAKRWGERGASGVFASPLFNRFHDALAQSWSESGGVLIHLLQLDSKPIAALYNLHWRGVEYFYQSGIDSRLKGQSPGLVLHAMAIERAARSGTTTYDFLGGEAHSYKGELGALPMPLIDCELYRHTWRGQLGRLTGRLD